MNSTDTICALSTPPGIGALAVIRISGARSFEVAANLFHEKSHFSEIAFNYAKWIEIFDKNQLIDQVVIVKYQAPHSYTGENMVEISCHGSLFIQKKILELLVQFGARLAKAGEFSMRAFFNNKMDLVQSEAVADIIDSQSETMHKLAVKQLKGGFSKMIHDFRQQVVDLSALMELELDFSEENVEFADRGKLLEILNSLQKKITALTDSFRLGNVLKNGIPIAIIGKPNVGKSTLLNVLVNEDRAIVSHIPGTTRDTIEDTITIDGYSFRFIDTAGIRVGEDEIEKFGIERTFKAIEKADLILYMIDITEATLSNIEEELMFLENEISNIGDKKIIIIANKIDEVNEIPSFLLSWNDYDIISISAKRNVNIDVIEDTLVAFVKEQKIMDNTLLTNVRHYDILIRVNDEIEELRKGFGEGLSTDLLTVHLNMILQYLGEITGEITTDEILNNIFGRFCIGK